MLNKVKRIITEEIRPELLKHHGNIEAISFEDGILNVRLLGQCNGCPSAKYTIENVIEKKIIESIPEIKRVSLVNEASDELYNFAKKVLMEKR